MEDLTDDELDAYIITHLRMLGVNLDVLPEDDRSAPADRKRILSSARRFLRTTPAAIAAFPLDPQEVVPGLYPVEMTEHVWRRDATD